MVKWKGHGITSKCMIAFLPIFRPKWTKNRSKLAAAAKHFLTAYELVFEYTLVTRES